jgi:hypothetical protein
MRKTKLSDFAYCLYLGCALGIFADVTWWQHLLISVPVISMVVLINEKP